jgi:insulysin
MRNATLMFSKMFSEPLFDINYMNKEIEAVNSEHEKNLNSDGWRKRQLLRTMGNPKHPIVLFSTGNSASLRNVTSERLNEMLKDFYKKFYQTNNMKLVILCKKYI